MVAADAAGTFAGYGADLRVTLGPDGKAMPAATAVVCGDYRPAACPGQPGRHGRSAGVRLVPTPAPEAAVQHGRELRDELAGRAVGVLVVADGAHTLSASAPGGVRAGFGSRFSNIGMTPWLPVMLRRWSRRTVSWGGWPFRCWPAWPSPGRERPRSTAARPTVWGTSPAPGSHETTRDHRPTGTGKSQLALELAERLGGAARKS